MKMKQNDILPDWKEENKFQYMIKTLTFLYTQNLKCTLYVDNLSSFSGVLKETRHRLKSDEPGNLELLIKHPPFDSFSFNISEYNGQCNVILIAPTFYYLSPLQCYECDTSNLFYNQENNMYYCPKHGNW